MVIDFHMHMLERSVFAASANRTVFSGYGANPVSVPRPGAGRLLEKMFDPAAILADMDERGIDMGVLTVSTVIQGTSWADPDLDAELCRRCNDQAARWVSDHPGRFVGSFVLPMQDTGLAMQEFRRCVDGLELRVVNLSSSYAGDYLGAARFQAFWEAVADRGVVAWIHPEGVRDPWFQDYAMWNSLGQSIEEAKCMASLIYEGVPARHPSLKLVIAHGGGYFPHYLGRMDRNAINRPDTLRHTGGRAPSEFLRAFHYDTCVYDPQVLQTLAGRVGLDRLVMGSDYAVGEADPVGWLRAAGLDGESLDGDGLDGEGLAQVIGGNAARLLGLA